MSTQDTELQKKKNTQGKKTQHRDLKRWTYIYIIKYLPVRRGNIGETEISFVTGALLRYILFTAFTLAVRFPSTIFRPFRIQYEVSWFSARTDFDMTTLLSSFWKVS